METKQFSELLRDSKIDSVKLNISQAMSEIEISGLYNCTIKIESSDMGNINKLVEVLMTEVNKDYNE